MEIERVFWVLWDTQERMYVSPKGEATADRVDDAWQFECERDALNKRFLGEKVMKIILIK